MATRIGTGLSLVPDARTGALEAAAAAARQLGGERCDLAIVFASGAHLAAPESTLAAVHETLEPDALVGPELTITAAEGHVIGELAGRPALEKLRETIEGLTPEDLQLVKGGLLM